MQIFKGVPAFQRCPSRCAECGCALSHYCQTSTLHYKKGSLKLYRKRPQMRLAATGCDAGQTHLYCTACTAVLRILRGASLGGGQGADGGMGGGFVWLGRSKCLQGEAPFCCCNPLVQQRPNTAQCWTNQCY